MSTNDNYACRWRQMLPELRLRFQAEHPAAHFRMWGCRVCSWLGCAPAGGAGDARPNMRDGLVAGSRAGAQRTFGDPLTRLTVDAHGRRCSGHDRNLSRSHRTEFGRPKTWPSLRKPLETDARQANNLAGITALITTLCSDPSFWTLRLMCQVHTLSSMGHVRPEGDLR
jgi:hypothetical protein